jgi:Mg2+ and Co2+ transporter CorA
MGFAFKMFTPDDREVVAYELEHTYQVTDLDVEDVCTNTQLSKLEKRPDYIYVAFQFPDLDPIEKIFVTKEVHFFVLKDSLVVYDKHGFSLMEKFMLRHQHRIERSETPFEAFYEALDYCVTRLARAMPKFMEEVDELEADLFSRKGTDKDFIFDILVQKRNLTTFQANITPIVMVISDLQAYYTKDQQVMQVELLDDALDKVRKVEANLASFLNQIGLMSDANEQLIARNTNEVIKLMTATSIIVIIPSFIAAFFGMNIYLGWDPGVRNWIPLAGVLIAMGGSIVGVIIYFKKRGWM